MHKAVSADLLANEDSTSNNLVKGLGRLEAMTSILATEKFFATEVDKSKIRNVTGALDVTARWLNKVRESAKKPDSNSELVARVNQWLAMRRDDKPVFAKREVRKSVQGFQGSCGGSIVICVAK